MGLNLRLLLASAFANYCSFIDLPWKFSTFGITGERTALIYATGPLVSSVTQKKFECQEGSNFRLSPLTPSYRELVLVLGPILSSYETSSLRAVSIKSVESVLWGGIVRKIVNLDWSSKILQKFLSAWDIEKLGFPHKDFSLNTGTAYEGVIVSQTWSSFLSSHQRISFCRHFS